MVSYNVRAAAIDFVAVRLFVFLSLGEEELNDVRQALVDSFETVALASLWSAFQRRAVESDAARAQSDDDWCTSLASRVKWTD